MSSKEDASASASKNPPEREAEVREHLANERTLLAWVRTGVGLLSFGLVVERLGALAALGCLSLVMGTLQFLRNRRGIVAGDFTPAVVT